jgi:hypothetical protein
LYYLYVNDGGEKVAVIAAEAIMEAIEARSKHWRPLARLPKWVGLMM